MTVPILATKTSVCINPILYIAMNPQVSLTPHLVQSVLKKDQRETFCKYLRQKWPLGATFIYGIPWVYLGFVQQGPCTCLAPCKMQV